MLKKAQNHDFFVTLNKQTMCSGNSIETEKELKTNYRTPTRV